jgi:hypothetical protein
MTNAEILDDLVRIENAIPDLPPADALCHYDLVPQSQCGHCCRIKEAREALGRLTMHVYRQKKVDE